MPIKATDVKRGTALMYEGQLQLVLDTEHVKPGKGPAYVQAKMKNVQTGTIKINRLNSSDKLEDATIDRKTMQYLYDGSGQGHGPFVFMDTQTYDQLEVDSDVLPKEQSQWLKENTEVVVLVFDGNPLGVELPAAVELEVTEAEPAVKGDRVSGATKPVTVSTGLVVQTPLFIEQGDRIRVATDSGNYITRAQ